MLVEGIVESEEVTDGVDKEKSVLFNEISLRSEERRVGKECSS